MALVSKAAQSIFAPANDNGTPRAPSLQEAQVWGTEIEALVAAVATAAAVFDSRSSLYASLSYAANTLAWVVSDGTAAYNGIYRKSGASGSGSWTRVADLPYSFIIATDAGAGTANAIQATTAIPVSNSALVWLNIFEANTASPVTVSFNGGAALTIKTNGGNNVTAGGLVAGTVVMGIVSGSTFRLVSDQASSAIVAAAEAAQAAAEAAAASINQRIYTSVALAQADTIPALAKRVQTLFYAPNYAQPATLKGGAYYRRVHKDITLNYASRGWFRSADRFLPDGTADSTNGGYWLLDEEVPNAHQFGGIGDGVVDDADALQALLDFWSVPAQQVSGSVTSRPLAMAGGGRVRIPKGVWRHTRTLYQNAYVVIEGDGNVMFPQAPLSGSWFAQNAFPNATILRPDFSLADREFGVCIQTSPYVLSKTGGSAAVLLQTLGTRFRPLSADKISGFDIDNGRINYSEGANIYDLTIWPVNEIFAGIRWTGAAHAEIDGVTIRGVKRGIVGESCWESSIYRFAVYDFKEIAVDLEGGNVHSFALKSGWIHAGGRVLAGDKPTGVKGTFFNGINIDAVAIDECWDAIDLQNGAGANILGVHSERTKNVWLTTNGATGIYGSGNHMIQNVVDARTYENTIIWDGNDCEVDINVSVNINGKGNNLHPGYTYFQGTNPNTGDPTALTYATGNRTSVTFRGMQPTANDAARVNRLSGNIRFVDDVGVWEIGGTGLGNQYSEIVDVKGDSGVKHIVSHRINGTQTHYVEADTAGVRWNENATNSQLLGFRYSDNALIYGGGLTIVPNFGNPNTFVDGPVGALCPDTDNGKLYIKTSAPGTLTGWVVVGTQT